MHIPIFSKQKFNDDNGFTLVEVVLVLALLSIILATVYNGFSFFYRGWERVEDESLAVQDARMALEMVGNDIRNALPKDEYIGVELNPEGTELLLGPKENGQIRYLVQDHQLIRQVYDESLAEYINEPGVLCKVVNDEGTHPFQLSGRMVSIKWLISDNTQPGSHQREIEAKFTVRTGHIGKGS